MPNGRYILFASGNGLTAGQPIQLGDEVPPDTVITSSPPSPFNQPNATFTFTSEPRASFECSLDGAAFSPCSSPATYSNLLEGQHTFRVLARDVAGNVGPSPASHSWTITMAASVAPVILSPTHEATVTDNKPVISGTAEPGSTITVTLDGSVVGTVTTASTGAWVFNPASALADGEHTVFATATTAGGTNPASATVRFTISTTTPKEPAPPSDGGCGCGEGPGDASWMLAGMTVLAGLTARRRRFPA